MSEQRKTFKQLLIAYWPLYPMVALSWFFVGYAFYRGNMGIMVLAIPFSIIGLQFFTRINRKLDERSAL